MIKKNIKLKPIDLFSLKMMPKGFIYPTQSKAQSLKEKKRLLSLTCKEYTDCQGCPLAQQGRNQVVFGDGSPSAKLMFIGEAPGKDEDLKGIPFIGRAGKLLTKIIEAMGLTRSDVYITNIVKCRPPQNRTPTTDERETCKPKILLKEINIIKPTIICTLGSPATKGLLGDPIKISEVRGKFFEWEGYTVLPTYHPAYLLRNPKEKVTVWEDMKLIMKALNLTSPKISPPPPPAKKKAEAKE